MKWLLRPRFSERTWLKNKSGGEIWVPVSGFQIHLHTPVYTRMHAHVHTHICTHTRMHTLEKVGQ